MANNLNERQKKILKILQDANSFLTASDLSCQLSVSTKTIYRDIQELANCNFEEYKLIKKENLGYMLVKEHRNEEDFIGISNPEERRINLLLYLLSIAPMKTSIQKLSERYFVSQSSILNDFKHIEKRIEPYCLKLRRERSGTFIEGHQLSVNRLMSVMIESFLKQAGDPFSQYAIPAFIDQVKNDYIRLHEIKKILHDIQEEHEILLDQPFYLTLFCSLLSVVEKNLNQLQPAFQEKSFEPVDSSSKIYLITKDLVKKLEEYYSFRLKRSDFNKLYYIFKAYKLNSRILLNQDTEEIMNEKVNLLSKQLIKGISEKSGYFLEDDELLNEQLTLHLHSMVYRLNHDIYIVNPILKSIQSNFKETFEMVKECAELVNMKGCFVKHITDEEIGYITLYFQISIDDKATKKIPVLIECSSGIGTSHLLSEKIRKTFPNLDIKRIVSQHRTKICDYSDIELVISTVKTHNANNKPTILVSPILNKEDKHKIEIFIDDYYKKQKTINMHEGIDSEKQLNNLFTEY